MKHSLRPLPLALALLLTACGLAPIGAIRHRPQVQAPTTRIVDIDTGAPAGPQAAEVDVWARLRSSFALPDCNASAAVDSWARRYTRSPQRFETQLREALPRLVYVQESAARHGVAGEFALLPWVESHFQPVAPHRQRAAGMWQIMPDTARHLGLVVDQHYDGRLDLPASTDEVMSMLGRYHDWFQDWRLVDYAYNAGSPGINKLVSSDGAPPAEPVVPRLPVAAGTREHLIKLMAIACVVRQPERYHVTLPTLDADKELVSVPVNQRLTLKEAAHQAGLPSKVLAELNAGYLDGVVDPPQGGHLLLPRAQADRLRTALLAQASTESPLVASVGPAAAPLAHADGRPPGQHAADGAPQGHTQTSAHGVHVVAAGETLFTIARAHHLSVDQLKRWNHLKSSRLQVGQKLRLRAPH